MIDFTNEPPLSIEQVRHLPECLQPDGSPPAWTTVNDWVRKGVCGVRLESGERPRGTASSRLAVMRFFEQLKTVRETPRVPKSKGPTPKQREKAIARAMATVATM